MPEKRNAQYYLRQLELADTDEKDYRKRASKTVDVYRDDKRTSGSRFNILWSNVETQLPALYSDTPKPDVRRRYRQDDPVARSVADVLQKSLEYLMDTGADRDYDRFGELTALDYTVVGRMAGRIQYSAEIAGDGATARKRGEQVWAHHVPWKHYRQAPASCWQDVNWVAYGDHFMTKQQIIDRYGKAHDDVPLDFVDEETDDIDRTEAVVKKAQVWELWDRDVKRVVHVVKGYDGLLDAYDDPLNLRDFYPGPEPALIVETPGTLLPVPEYTMYQDQAEELNEVTARLSVLTRAMKAKGFFPGEEVDKIEQLLNSDETIVVPVEDWAAHAEKGGIKGLIDWMPIEAFVSVWEKLIVRRNLIIRDIFELTGISDIQRGMSDPRETRGAQVLKANFGNRRFIKKQKRIQRFHRDMLRIEAEIVAEHFSRENLAALTGIDVTDEMVEMMRSDRLRSFAVDIETDSTIAPDDALEKQGASEFLAAMSQYLNVVYPIVQAQPAAVEPLGSMLLWLTRKFKIARPVEADVERFIETIRQLPAQKNTEHEAAVAELQAKLQLQAAEKQGKQQIAQMEAQAEVQRENAESAAEIRRKDAESQAKIEREARELAMKEREAGLRERVLIAQGDREDQKARQAGTERRAAAMGVQGNVVPIDVAKHVTAQRAQDGSMVGEVVADGVTKRFNMRRTRDGYEGEIVPALEDGEPVN